MFVTQKEIEARLASDDNLLNVLLDRRPSGPREFPSEIKDETGTESLEESDDETASANFINTEPTYSRNRGINLGNRVDDGDPDVKLRRILDEAEQDQSTRDYSGRSGRPDGAVNRSTEQRADIALMGQVLGHGLAADLLGISTASSSLHSRGQVNHDDEIDFELAKVVKRKLHKIRNKSADALIKVLDHAESASMYDQIKSPKDAMFVANGLASVIQKVKPEETEQKPTAQFVIIQPTVRSVEQYEVINV